MVGQRDVGGRLADLVTHWIVLVVAGELGDVAVERCREQHGLAIVAGLVQQAADSGHEAHVGHAIGFVENDSLDLGEVDVAALDQVFEATRAGDEHVDALLEQAKLLAVTDAAVDDADTCGLAERGQLDADLVGEFAGWRKDQRGRVVGASLRQVGDDGDAKGDGLA